MTFKNRFHLHHMSLFLSVETEGSLTWWHWGIPDLWLSHIPHSWKADEVLRTKHEVHLISGPGLTWFPNTEIKEESCVPQLALNLRPATRFRHDLVEKGCEVGCMRHTINLTYRRKLWLYRKWWQTGGGSAELQTAQLPPIQGYLQWLKISLVMSVAPFLPPTAALSMSGPPSVRCSQCHWP